MGREVDKDGTEARIGMVNFINTAPLYEIWRLTVDRPEWQVIEAPPATLNRMLADDELDIGFVSAYEYGRRPDIYRILQGLSISSTGRVGSVFLFSRRNPADLDGKKVLLSPHSATSVALVKILLEDIYQVKPFYEIGIPPDLEGGGMDAGLEDIEAVLAIGDNALRLQEKGGYPVQLDLGKVWQDFTGSPFVFALFVVREDFCRRSGGVVGEIQNELLRCVSEGKRDLREICFKVAPRIPMSEEDCYNYLLGIEHDLDDSKIGGLTRFFDFLIKKNEISPAALPLKFF
ncbi:MAG: menaquinone biosynthetic enzyme MqnA/MqnD family protein [Desulfurivibrionaceae bacterium]